MYKNFPILVCLKSLCLLDEAKHQDERSAARHTENRAGMPGAYSDLLITSHARDFNLTSLAKGDMQILIQLTSIECLLHAMCQQAFTFHILDSGKDAYEKKCKWT